VKSRITMRPETQAPHTVDDALVQSEKLSALGRMVAAIAHDINNPLTAILGQVQLLLRVAEVAQPIRERLTIVADEAFRAARIVENLLTFARHTPPARRPCSLVELIRWVLELSSRQLQQSGIEVVTELESCPPVWLDENQIRQVLLNLVENAEQAMKDEPAPRRLTVRLGRSEAEGRVRIEIGDTGPAIPADALPRIFDPFVTTKRSGTGLGLWVALAIVEQHGGQLSAENQSAGGAVFIITLPYRKSAR